VEEQEFNVNNDVNMGYENWLSLRSEWNRKPNNYQPKPRGEFDKKKVMQEVNGSGVLSHPVPLNVFLKIISESWETEGII